MGLGRNVLFNFEITFFQFRNYFLSKQSVKKVEKKEE